MSSRTLIHARQATSARTAITAGRATTARMMHLRGPCNVVQAGGGLSTTTRLVGGRITATLAPVDVPIRPGTAVIRRMGSRGTACRWGPHSGGLLYNPYAYYSIININPQINNFRTGFWGFGVIGNKC